MAREANEAIEITGSTSHLVHIEDLGESFQMTSEMALRLCDAVSDGSLEPKHLETIASTLIASDWIEWHDEDVIEIHPHDAESRGIEHGDWVGLKSRAGETVLRADITERVQPGVVYTTFHHPESGANVVTTDNSDWATNCPEYKVTAVQAHKVTTPSEWQKDYESFSKEQVELMEQARR